MIRVAIESPYAASADHSVTDHIEYARAAMLDCLNRGEAPFASHLLYTQHGVLDDGCPEDRSIGVRAGLSMSESCEMTAVYYDLGISHGMRCGIEAASAVGRRIEFRSILDTGRRR